MVGGIGGTLESWENASILYLLPPQFCGWSQTVIPICGVSLDIHIHSLCVVAIICRAERGNQRISSYLSAMLREIQLCVRTCFELNPEKNPFARLSPFGKACWKGRKEYFGAVTKE